MAGTKLDLMRDKADLAHARALKAVLDAVVHALKSDAALSDKAMLSKPVGEIKDPFG